ncbi:glycosyltransferase family 4 protein [Mesonia sp. HuA40]|uniref:glycosyltransferase family 4 protein n=1 Tax=Mesonia sp. HuA40 TaxID=2602761 RepID=UPI0011C84AFF|nr:glycosyltransferase family 4 protein [Mesonia sp. HuA40]TXK75414.1 glycosyltransferase family 4 protein [Mesonia sp. HuA40]
MPKHKLIRITTVPLSLEKLLEGQLEYMQQYYEVTGISADCEKLEELGRARHYNTFPVEMTRQITPWQDVKALWRLYNYLKQEKPTIVHTHTPKAGIVGMLAAKLAGVPIRLHTVAGLPLMEATGIKRKILNAVERVTYACATKVYPNSVGLQKFILKQGFTHKNKLKIIGQGSSNGIDTSHFDPKIYDESIIVELRKELGITSEDFVFIFVGRLVSDKGINELVQAFQNLKLKGGISGQNAKLLLVGPLETELDPLHEETLEAIASNAAIISVGYQEDVRPYLAVSDALAFPSYREGFPNVVMQAGAMGLPAIVSDINGCNEIIIPNKNGIIIPPKNTEALQDAMQELMHNQNLYQQLKSNARNLITTRYERQKVWEALLEEYRGLGVSEPVDQ